MEGKELPCHRVRREELTTIRRALVSRNVPFDHSFERPGQSCLHREWDATRVVLVATIRMEELVGIGNGIGTCRHDKESIGSNMGLHEQEGLLP